MDPFDIRIYLLRNNMGVKELAEKAHLSRPTINNFIRGRIKINYATAKMLADAFEGAFTLEQLLSVTPTNPKNKASNTQPGDKPQQTQQQANSQNASMGISASSSSSPPLI